MRRHSPRPLAAVLVAMPLLQSPSAQPYSAITVTAHGVQMTIDVPSHVFPRDALEGFTVHVRNVSRHTVLTRVGQVCFEPNPSVDVRDSEGNLTAQFPTGAVPLPCPAPIGYPFRAGQTWTGRVFAVMNGVSVQADLRIGRHLARRIRTSPAAVGTAASMAPTVQIQSSSAGPFVVLPRPPGAHGPLYALGSSYCVVHGVQRGQWLMSWTPVHGNRVASGCTGPQQWHMYAGYVGYPVATINYTSP